MSLEQQFPKGMIVKLKSGGPDMAVQSVYQGSIQCQWFAGKKLEAGRFPPESLVAVQPAPAPEAE